MKLKPFLDFVEKHQVTEVLHRDETRSGIIKNIDYDDKKISIAKYNGGNSMIKLETLLKEYQLLLTSSLGNYVRLGQIHNYGVGAEVLYIKDGSSYSGTKGVVTKVTNNNVTVEWTHGEKYNFGNDSTLKDILFVRVKTDEEIAMEDYAAKMKKIAEDANKPEYFVFSKIHGVPADLLCVINATNAEKAKSVIPPIYKYVDTMLLLKVGGQ